MFGSDGEFTRMWRKPGDLRSSYDVVIIGGGVHGLATAYYLAKHHGITNVAVLDRAYIGAGGSGRNTAIVRSNYRTAEGVPFYDESVKLYESMAAELDINVMFSQHGHLTLAHTDRGINTLRERAEMNQILGVNSRVIFPEEIKRLVPAMSLDTNPHYPVLAALYHPPGGIIRHDAVVWGYARGADRLGVEIHPFTNVTGIVVRDGAVQTVQTNRGDIRCKYVLNATAGWCSTICKMVNLDIPIVTHPLQALVSERLKPFLDQVIVSATLHIYVNQTERGELVIGQEIDPYSSYSQRSTLPFLEGAAAHTLELFPCLREVKILRQWGGLCDMTPDYSPIMGFVEGIKGFILDVGWGTYGFKAGPVSGKRIAELIATEKTPNLIAPFALSRFYNDTLVGEKAAASVSS
ncbi:MAG: FAD-dependent oxidoreductase [Verrucomicrobiae bacterium]|nr:FAD-dependent oxidoreductase [Verrucomicrobiae bacterium]